MCQAPELAHLRGRSAYSFGIASSSPAALAAHAKAGAIKALAICDTDHVFAAPEHDRACRAHGIAPLIGCDLGHLPLTPTVDRPKVQLPLLVMDDRGWQSLSALSGQRERDHAATPDAVREHAEGLIALTGGAGSELRHLVAAGREEDACRHLEDLRDAFERRLCVEIQRHGTAEEAKTERAILGLASRLKLPLVATAEILYARPDDRQACELIACIHGKTTLDGADRLPLPGAYHLPSNEEMASRFADLPIALKNTLAVAERCTFRLSRQSPRLPVYAPDEVLALREQALQGLATRLGSAPGHDYTARVAHELDVICRCGFAGYFLIVADYVGWARSNGIPVGPGRGSGAGSLVAWALGITALDPLAHGLLFERFLNEHRVNLPDFDVDFCQDRREEVIAYIRKRWGADRVAGIVTFQRLQAKAALRDTCRAMGLPLQLGDKLSSLIPDAKGQSYSLDQAMAAVPQLRSLVESNPDAAKIVQAARAIEGLPKATSEHPGGLVIADKPLAGNFPVFRPRGDNWVCQFDKDDTEKLGLVKFDVLGVRYFTLIEEARRLVLGRTGRDPEPASLRFDDPAAYELIRAGSTAGLFQISAPGMTRAAKELAPSNFDDLAALIALYRPGPMANIPTYTARKRGEAPLTYPHPVLEPVLAPTQGIFIYQEQVMEAARLLAGYSLAEADLLRRAMGKKDHEAMALERERFVRGAVERQIPQEKATEIFDLFAAFADYGFNKSHAVAYAAVTYQTAFYKARYPAEFATASLNAHLAEKDKNALWIGELRKAGIAVFPPCVTHSEAKTVILPGKEGVRLGLAAIAGFGQAAAINIAADRAANGPFKSLSDFWTRLRKHLNRRHLEILAKAGAFASLEADRGTILAQLAAPPRKGGELFGPADATPFGEAALWTPAQNAAADLETIGVSLGPDPFRNYASCAEGLQAIPLETAQAAESTGKALLVIGLASNIQARTSKQSRAYTSLTLRDASGSADLALFDSLNDTARGWLTGEMPVAVTVVPHQDRGLTRLRVRQIAPLAAVIASRAKALILTVGQVAPAYVADAKAAIAALADGETTLIARQADKTGSVRDIHLGRRVALTQQVVDLLARHYALSLQTIPATPAGAT